MSTTTHQPALRAFTVIKREGQDDFWLPIGAAFAHQSGDGFNVILQALPISDGNGQCKIVLRPPKDDKTADPGSQESDSNVSRLRDDRTNKSGSRRR